MKKINLIIVCMLLFLITACSTEEPISNKVDSIYVKKYENKDFSFFLYFSQEIKNLNYLKLNILIEDQFQNKLKSFEIKPDKSIFSSDFEFNNFSNEMAILVVLNNISKNDIKEFISVEFKDGSKKAIEEKIY